jgi:hypothetical protein
MFGLGTLGFFLTWTAMVVTVTRAVTNIKSSTDQKVAEETAKITERLNGLSEQFEEDQKIQDNRVGEGMLSLRQYTANIEKEMHKIEIWGRDNFVLKPDFHAAIHDLGEAIGRLASDVKDDFRLMHQKLDETIKRN